MAATSTAFAPKLSRADIAKLFQNHSSSSSQPSSDTPSPSTLPSNLPPHQQPSSLQLQQPSQLGAHSYSQFVPNSMRSPQQHSGTPRSRAFSRVVPNVQGQSRQGTGPGGPGGPPIPTSPRMAPHPHQALPGGMPSQHMHQAPHPQHVLPLHEPGPLPMSPRSAASQLPGIPTMAHTISHPPHTPQLPPSISCPPSTANTPCFRRSTSKVTIKTRDGVEVTLDDLKKFGGPPSTVFIPPPSLVVTNLRRRSVSVRIESEDSRRAREENARREQEMMMTIKKKKEEEERAKKHEAEEEEGEKERLRQEEEDCLGIDGFQKPCIPSSFQMGNSQCSGSKLTSEGRFAMSNSRSASTSSASSHFRFPMVRTPSTRGSGHSMHGTSRTRSKRGKRRGHADKVPVSQEEHGSGFGAAPILGAGFEPVVPLELSANRWVPTSTTRKAQLDVDSPELVDRKVRALLNKLTMEKFGTISNQIIHWANRNVNEKNGALIQIIRLVFEKATGEAACSEMCARLCQKMMEQISPEVQDDGIKNTKGKPIAGGQLFRKYLLDRCQENFERRWFVKEVTAAAAAVKAFGDHAIKAANDKKGTLDAGLDFDKFYVAQKAKRQGLNLITFIGELFKARMLTKRFMHECVKKLLDNIENPEEEKIEILCQMLKTVGQLLDTPQAHAHMDVYFTRMKELAKSYNVSTRMQFMLQDVIELRDRVWMCRDAAPLTIAATHMPAAKERAAAEECLNRQMSMSRGGEVDVHFTNLPHELCFRLVDNRQIRMFRDCPRGRSEHNQEHGPDGWAAPGGSVLWAPPKADNMSQFGRISRDATMTTSPSSMVAGRKKDNKRKTFSRMNSSSNMFYMLSQISELSAETSTKPSRSSSQKPSTDLGHDGVSEPVVQHRKLQLFPQSVRADDDSMITALEATLSLRLEPNVGLGHAGVSEPECRKLQLLPRSVLATEENATTPSEEEFGGTPTVMSEADFKKINEYVKEFFTVRDLQVVEAYSTNLPTSAASGSWKADRARAREQMQGWRMISSRRR